MTTVCCCGRNHLGRLLITATVAATYVTGAAEPTWAQQGPFVVGVTSTPPSMRTEMTADC